ncbi:MAG: RNA 2',3'-cyclic phosphodiesterase [Chloroflexi bacterium]|nr:RNA 2',3'-cyclic phosphodiesterase [Chloroflexota bacterium]
MGIEASSTTAAPRPPPNERLRLFVAIELPETWRSYLAERAAQLERLAPGYARWVAPERLHLTVVFLGEQPWAQRAAIERALQTGTTGQPPFPLALGRLGHFGGTQPRVLWMGARAPGGALEALHAAVGEALAAEGVVFDRKPLVAHLTLGRARQGADPASGRLLAQRLPSLSLPAAPPPFTVDAVTLMRSELRPAGPRYTPLARFPLTPPGGRETPA